MNTFKELYEQSKKDKTLRPLTAQYRKWEKPGDFILGRLVGVSTVTSSLGGGTYNQYLFETDEGLVKFALGKSGDSEIGAVLSEGQVYRIEFLGQQELTGGRRVNKFSCVEIGFGEGLPEPIAEE